MPKVPDIPVMSDAIGREEKELILPAVTKPADNKSSNLTDLYLADDVQKYQQENGAETAMTIQDFAGMIADNVVKASIKQLSTELTLGHLGKVTDAVDNLVLPQSSSSTAMFAKNTSNTARGAKHVRIKENLLAKALPLQVIDVALKIL